MREKKLMLLDGLSLINRAFYALPVLTAADGTPTNAILGFLNIFFKLVEEESPGFVAVAFDLPAPTFRKLKYSQYKATRKPFPDELQAQIPILKDVLKAMNVAVVQQAGYEADDIMGTLANQAGAAGFVTSVVSGDRDLLQIATNTIKIRIPKTSKGQTTVEDWTSADFVEKMGITPRQYIDMKALMGDPGDNIPGVPGIGEKTALAIIKEYGDLENAIANSSQIKPKRASENLAQFTEQARLSKMLATIVTDADIAQKPEDFAFADFINENSLDIFRKLELKSILKKYPDNRRGAYHAPPAPSNEPLPQFLSNATACAYFLTVQNNKPTGLALSHSGKSAYYPWTEDFTPFFQGGINKIGFNTKKDIHILHNCGITMHNLMSDLLLAGYLLGSLNDGSDLNELSLEYLKEAIPSTEGAAGPQQLSLLDAPEADPDDSASALAQVAVIARAYPIMAEMLEQRGLTALMQDVEMPLIQVLADMERHGIAVNAEFISDYGQKLDMEINRLTTEIHNLAGSQFNINSTKQLAKVLFEDLGIKGIKKTKTGFSTNVEVLEKLATHHEIARKILEYRSHQKLRSTYVDGLLAAIGPDGKVRTTFNQASTSTGRLSSADPNLQNIPVRTELGRELRRAFIPSAGFTFIDADYSQIELRILAHLSQDEVFLQAFREGLDIHKITAAKVFHVEHSGVTEEMRRMAKAVNFGIVYGISAFSLAEDIKSSVREAESLIDGYFARYPRVKAYLDTCIADARARGVATTIFGRQRVIPELFHSNHNTRQFGERAAMNMPVQGTAADIIKIAMVKVSKRLAVDGLKARLVLQVHDELLLEAPEHEIEPVKAILHEEMENAVKLSVPLAIDIKTGSSWYGS